MKKYICVILILFLWCADDFYVFGYTGRGLFPITSAENHDEFKAKDEADEIFQMLKTLNELGIARGDEKGDFRLKSKLKREDAVILITQLLNEDALRGKKEWKQANLSEIKFKDVLKESYYAPYIAFATKSSIVGGVSNEIFGVGRNITQREFLILLLRLLNYEVIWDKTDIAALSKELGLLQEIAWKPDEQIDREEAFRMIYHTLFAEVNESGTVFYKTRGFSLVEKQEKLEIKSAISKNLREVEIEFNKSLSTYLKEIKVKAKNAHLGNISPRISQKHDKIILSCGINMQNGGFYEFEIEGVYARDGAKLKQTAVSLLAFDVKNPEIIQVEQKEDVVEVFFDEPISNYGKISLHPAKNKRDVTFPSFRNIYLSEFGTKLSIRGLSYEYDVDYIMNFSDYKDYVGKRGMDLEKEIRFQKIQK